MPIRPTVRFSRRGPPGYSLIRKLGSSQHPDPSVRYDNGHIPLRAIRAMVLTCTVSLLTWVGVAIVYFAMR
ncbi:MULTISPECIES: hypothetical protein [unclassified Sphingomonas]|uniref:hypothetical protein n=1 Tax=unclassified Sphingomonas TaxID=196159 RepID=UPI001F56E654|nr:MULTISPECIES: hypothetical protein [unclassified Sphingomonas]